MAISRHMANVYRLSHGDYGDPSITVGDSDVLGTGETGGSDKFLGASYGYGYVAYGDAYEFDGSATGGADKFVAGSWLTPESVGSGEPGGGHFLAGGGVFAGDAGDMWGTSLGGNDTFSAGLNSSVEFAGDALGTMGEAAMGGNDTMSLGAVDARGGLQVETFKIAYGDAFEMMDAAHGGNDSIVAGRASAYGDGYAVAFNVVVGDGYGMAGTSTGGNDSITGGDVFVRGGQAIGFNVLAGDAMAGGESAAFGNDKIVGGDASGDGYSIAFNLMAGDVASFATGSMHFGSDFIQGGAGHGESMVVNVMYGDMGATTGLSSIFLPTNLESLLAQHGGSMYGASAYEQHGGETLDALIGTLSGVEPQGILLAAGSVYGNDVLAGGSAQAINEMVGDTQELSDGETGGDDQLTAGGATTQNILIGDAITMDAGSVGGNDVLVSGMGNDEMWGDAQSNSGIGGADLFVFKPSNGQDIVHDFQVGIDHIALGAFRSTNLPHTFAALVESGRIAQVGSDVVIDLSPVHSGGGGPGPLALPDGEVDTITLVGVNLYDLSTGDFIF